MGSIPVRSTIYYENNSKFSYSSDIYNKNIMGRCLNCSLDLYNKNNKFCNRSCAATYNNKNRTQSQATKDKISESVRQYLDIHPINRPTHYVTLTCRICSSNYDRPKWSLTKTCGLKDCKSELNRTIQRNLIISGSKTNTWGGRCKKIIYNGLLLDGSYELEFVKWLLRNTSILPEKNNIGFRYDDNNKSRIYFPDFKLSDTLFVECKGYERELDRKKWSQFPYDLIILKANEIKKLKSDIYSSIDDLLIYKYKK